MSQSSIKLLISQQPTSFASWRLFAEKKNKKKINFYIVLA